MVESENIKSEIRLTHSRIVMRNDGILELHTNDNHEYEINDVKENVEATGKLTGSKKVPVLVVGGAFTSVSKEARAFMASEESLKYSMCEAFLLNSLAQKLLINFYISIHKPLVPTVVFTDKTKAIEWLKGFL